ncbi:MAG: hypothetical protein J3K34DRAFT_428330 [Monoraphidium minutum]|nr:MAG: hypothetical protein J3K34DRAFT_428330 [Monoraphidium minutum]
MHLTQQNAGLLPRARATKQGRAFTASRAAPRMPVVTARWRPEPQSSSGRGRAAAASVARAASHAPQRQRLCWANPADAASAPLVAVEGDMVTIHFSAKSPDGQTVESTRTNDEPLTFEIGAGEIMGNPIFKAFDGAVRGQGVGEVVEIEISGGDWRPELLFTVPRDHPEVERLEGRYKNVGGLAEGLVVELSNGSTAVVLEMTDEAIKVDANNIGAGKTLTFEVELVDIQRTD